MSYVNTFDWTSCCISSFVRLHSIFGLWNSCFLLDWLCLSLNIVFMNFAYLPLFWHVLRYYVSLLIGLWYELLRNTWAISRNHLWRKMTGLMIGFMRKHTYNSTINISWEKHLPKPYARHFILFVLAARTCYTSYSPEFSFLCCNWFLNLHCFLHEKSSRVWISMYIFICCMCIARYWLPCNQTFRLNFLHDYYYRLGAPNKLSWMRAHVFANDFYDWYDTPHHVYFINCNTAGSCVQRKNACVLSTFYHSHYKTPTTLWFNHTIFLFVCYKIDLVSLKDESDWTYSRLIFSILIYSFNSTWCETKHCTH